jgi:hypothetical protein
LVHEENLRLYRVGKTLVSRRNFPFIPQCCDWLGHGTWFVDYRILGGAKSLRYEFFRPPAKKPLAYARIMAVCECPRTLGPRCDRAFYGAVPHRFAAGEGL